MEFSNFEVVEKKPNRRYFAMKYKGVPKTFPEWKQLIEAYSGPVHYSVYRFSKLKKDPDLKAKHQEFGDAVLLEEFEPGISDALEPEDQVIARAYFDCFTNIKHYLSDEDFGPNTYILFVYDQKLKKMITERISEVQFKKQFLFLNKTQRG